MYFLTRRIANLAVARNKNLTNGSLWDKILLFAIPLALTGMLQQLYNAADVAIVGNFVGTEAQAAVGVNGPVINLMINLFMGMSVGTNVVVSRAIGKGDKDLIEKGVHSSLLLALIGGFLIMGIGEFVSKPLLSLMNIPEEIFDMALTYFRIYVAGMPVLFLYNFEAAVFRSNGDSKTPLIVLASSGLINVGLNLFFVLVLNMNVEGVAIATIIANIISAIVLFIILINTSQVIRVYVKKLKLNVKTVVEILKIGVPSGIQSCMYSVANIILQSATNTLGSIAIAGASTAGNVTTFSYFVVNSFGQASTTFVGQNNGAGNMKRCKRSMFVSFGIGFVAFSLVAAVLIIFANPIFSLFNQDPNVWEFARTGLYCILLSYPFNLMQDVVSGYLRGFGYSFVPAVIAVVFICVFRIIWINTAFPIYNDYLSLAVVYPISLFLTALASVIALLIIRPAKKREFELEQKGY